MNLLINTLKDEIELAKKTCVRCPKCLRPVTSRDTIIVVNGYIYHRAHAPTVKK